MYTIVKIIQASRSSETSLEPYAKVIRRIGILQLIMGLLYFVFFLFRPESLHLLGVGGLTLLTSFMAFLTYFTYHFLASAFYTLFIFIIILLKFATAGYTLYLLIHDGFAQYIYVAVMVGQSISGCINLIFLVFAVFFTYKCFTYREVQPIPEVSVDMSSAIELEEDMEDAP